VETGPAGGNPISTPRTALLAGLLISVLVTAGCGPGNDSGDASRSGASRTSDGGTANLQNTSSLPRTGAARLLPDLSRAGFPVAETDLKAQPRPKKAALALIGQALGDARAPRFEVTGVEAATTDEQAAETADLATSALACLQQKGARAMHAYVDTRYRYSMAVALVIDVKAYRPLDVAWCAVTSQIPYAKSARPAGAATIAPCVGERRTGSKLVTWVATTDTMCAALGDPVAPAARNLVRGNTGTDVTRLQLALNDVGSGLTVDGRFGSGTISALRAFQDCYAVGTRRPGAADPVTLSALTAAASSGWSKDLCSP
jgi:hypothetical protein